MQNEQQSENGIDQLVVIGSSAGGIEALSTLPDNFPAPIMIAQHLDPRRPSHLAEILSHRTKLPVHTVEDHAMLENGVIFVVPSDRHVEIADHGVHLREDNLGPPKPSVDLLFSSAAAAFGEQLIAVVLTGTGSDGAAGAREVKEAGGTVIIQNPTTASFPDMPESLAPTTVDIVTDLENIGPLLYNLLTGAYMPARPGDEQALDALLEQLRERSGIDFTAYKPPTIMRRLQRRIAAAGVERLPDYIRYLQSHPEEYQRLVSSFLIKVTEFFRDPELFAYLRERVIPQLVEEARTRGNEIRLWSAGCATGEEAYSLAILVAEALGDQLDRYNVRVFATDLDADAIAFARRGIYPAVAFANLPRETVERYFNNQDDEYEVKKRVRALTVFGQHDLGQRAPFPRIDLCLCRNVLIYFTGELQKRALQLFAFSLRDGGFLVLGKAETTTPLTEAFVPDQPALKVYRRRGERFLVPPARIRNGTPLSPARVAPAARHAPASAEEARTHREAPRAPSSSEVLGAFLFASPIGVVVVDRRYDIQTINSAARRLLGIHTTAIGEDFIHLAQRAQSNDLRNAIDAAFRHASSSGVEDMPAIDIAVDETRYLRVSCFPQHTRDDGAPVDRVLILVTDVTTAVRERQTLAAEAARQRDESARLAARLEQLTEANRELLEANDELTTINMELRGANEEFLVSNEEAQAATEEVETLNEELQATNEELETLNEELQATVEELNTTNDDLQARGIELQDMTLSLETQRRSSDEERSWFSNILMSLPDAVMVVDNAGSIVLTNAAYDDLLGAGHSFMPHDEEGRPLPRTDWPQYRAGHGESFQTRFLIVADGGARQQFEAIGRPLQSTSSAQGGTGVLVIRAVETGVGG